MRPNRDHHTGRRTRRQTSLWATPALSLALAIGPIACGESLADPASAEVALQTAGSVSDQDHQHGPGLFRLLEELELNAEQQAAVERIQTELREKNEPLHERIRSTLGISDNERPGGFALREATREQREALRPIFDELQANHRAAMDEVRAVLTPEQQQTLEALRRERTERREARRADAAGARGHGGPPFAGTLLRLPSELELTADQQAELERIRTELSEKNEPLHEQIHSTLGISADESPGRSAFREATEEQRDALRPIVEQLRANQRAALEEFEALLTPEQQQRLDSLRAEHRERGPWGGGFLRGRRAS